MASAPPIPAVQTIGLTRTFGALTALNSLDLTVNRGDLFGFIGSNGAGKTTTLRILATFLAPTAGRALVLGHDVVRDADAVRHVIGYMPDFFGVYPDLTAVEYLEFYAGIHGIPRKKQASTVNDLLELVDLSSRRDANVETLSRGMKQRLCLARALVHDPEILLLDEPASGLDPRARVELRELLRTLQGMGKTIIISSHILLELAEMCTDIAIIQGGQLVVSGDVEHVTRRIGGGRQIEIRVLERVPETTALLKEIEGINNVTSENGDLLQAEFTGDDRALHSVLARLITEGIPVVSFAQRSSGGRLEEVFMSITEGSSPS